MGRLALLAGLFASAGAEKSSLHEAAPALTDTVRDLANFARLISDSEGALHLGQSREAKSKEAQPTDIQAKDDKPKDASKPNIREAIEAFKHSEEAVVLAKPYREALENKAASDDYDRVQIIRGKTQTAEGKSGLQKVVGAKTPGKVPGKVSAADEEKLYKLRKFVEAGKQMKSEWDKGHRTPQSPEAAAKWENVIKALSKGGQAPSAQAPATEVPAQGQAAVPAKVQDLTEEQKRQLVHRAGKNIEPGAQVKKDAFKAGLKILQGMNQAKSPFKKRPKQKPIEVKDLGSLDARINQMKDFVTTLAHDVKEAQITEIKDQIARSLKRVKVLREKERKEQQAAIVLSGRGAVNATATAYQFIDHEDHAESVTKLRHLGQYLTESGMPMKEESRKLGIFLRDGDVKDIARVGDRMKTLLAGTAHGGPKWWGTDEGIMAIDKAVEAFIVLGYNTRPNKTATATASTPPKLPYGNQ